MTRDVPPTVPPASAPSPRLVPPRAVQEIAATLEAAGYETWCVGGAVRDALLGLPHLDWDLATAATPAQVKRAFRRTVPVGEEFGTIGVLDRDGRLYEVTTFRRDVRTDGRHAVVEFGASLKEDLARRDFTINAMAWSPRREVLFDPFGGQEDLRRRVVRAVGEPRARMVEDRLRALRAIRFAGRFGFRIDDATWRAIVESAPYLRRLSRERIKQELEKTMEQVRLPGEAMALWRSCGALRELLPTLEAQPPAVLAAADCVPLPDAVGDLGRKRRRTLVRLATLLTGLSFEQARRALRDLRFSNRDVDWVAHLAVAATRMRAALDAGLEAGGEVPDAELRRWAASAGRTRVADALRVALAAAGPARAASPDRRRRALSFYRRAIRVAYRDPVELADLAVDGEELMAEAGVPRGPALGETLRRLLDAVLEDPSRNTREALLGLAHAWHSPDTTER